MKTTCRIRLCTNAIASRSRRVCRKHFVRYAETGSYKLKPRRKVKNRDNGYTAVHRWVYANITRTNKCYFCFKECKTQFSNIDHEYRRDVSEWQELCASCHARFDFLVNSKHSPGRPKKPKHFVVELRVLEYPWLQYKTTNCHKNQQEKSCILIT